MAGIAPDDAGWLARISERAGRVLFGATGPAGAATERVSEAAEAASWLAARYIARVDAGTLEVPLLIEDDPAVLAGCVTLAVRVFSDPASPAGSLASEAYTGVYVPADLLEHVRHYFDAFRAGGLGIA
jgi:hypothetical protein